MTNKIKWEAISFHDRLHKKMSIQRMKTNREMSFFFFGSHPLEDVPSA